ncbi:UNVERIFIED_CONTAM: hypothetical protein Sradi_2098100 [Sesamum radiatum]|uniref:Uncharacterized protein n=1 Tax=Sesamum radiatum TaxID=300843 RepID=A0AAW2TJ99_SESRA
MVAPMLRYSASAVERGDHGLLLGLPRDEYTTQEDAKTSGGPLRMKARSPACISEGG